jgi:spermidine synthase
MTARASPDRALLLNVLLVAVCALVYELLCGTLASFLLGDAVLQFSLVLGTYLFAMGAGAWVSKRFEPHAATRFVQAEIALAIVGGLAMPALLALVSAHAPLRPLLHLVVFVIGALVGLELPLLVRILKDRHAESPGKGFADTVARALAYDYAGALAASVLFPLVLVPRVGLVRTGVIAGMLNVLIALGATFLVRTERPLVLRASGAVVLVVLAVAFARAEGWVAGATD